ncbi:MAG: hypothetical protein GY696_33405 [Gammaproteobacteria bacterium]|nr:hypothetical protein [Gammaproteobacteria bacterium]
MPKHRKPWATGTHSVQPAVLTQWPPPELAEPVGTCTCQGSNPVGARQDISRENARIAVHLTAMAGFAPLGLAMGEADTSPEGVTASTGEDTGARWMLSMPRQGPKCTQVYNNRPAGRGKFEGHYGRQRGTSG